MGAFIISPLPSFLMQASCAARFLRSTNVTPLHRYCEPSRRRLVVHPFPGSNRLSDVPASADFSVGTRTVSPVARLALVIVPSLPPRRSDASLFGQFDDFIILPSPPHKGLGLRNLKF